MTRGADNRGCVAGRPGTMAGGPLTAGRIRRFAAVAFLSLGLAAMAAGAESWSLTAGEVRVRCRLTVGGSFDAVTSAISGTLREEGAGGRGYAGPVRVRLDVLDTGIGLRNIHLREKYLEVERGEAFREAVLTAVELGEPFPPGARGHKTRFAGLLSLHGVERRVEGEAELTRREGRLRVEAEFPLSLADFEVPPPRYLGVGVRDELRITVTFDAAIAPSPPGAPP